MRTEVNRPLIPQAPEYTLQDTWNSFTPKATLSYQITPTVLTYATYSKGFRSGGFDGLIAVDRLGRGGLGRGGRAPEGDDDGARVGLGLGGAVRTLFGLGRIVGR